MGEYEFKIEVESIDGGGGVVVRFIDRTWPDPSQPKPTYALRKEQTCKTWAIAMMQAAAWVQDAMDN